jgi:hypothetical protein
MCSNKTLTQYPIRIFLPFIDALRKKNRYSEKHSPYGKDNMLKQPKVDRNPSLEDKKISTDSSLRYKRELKLSRIRENCSQW